MTVREIISRALRLLRVIAAGENPGASEADDALTAFNAMCAAMMGHGVGQPLVRDYEASAGDIAASGGLYSVAVYTPEGPQDGDRIGVTGAVTVTASTGSTIESAASVTTTTATTWFYRADTADWVRVADRALADSPLFPADMHDYLAYLLCPRIADEYGVAISEAVAVGIARAEAAFAQRYGARLTAQIDAGLLTANAYYDGSS